NHCLLAPPACDPTARAAFAVLHGAGNGLLTIAKEPCRWRSSGRSAMACQRNSRRAGAGDASGIAAALRPFDGSHGHRRPGDLRRPSLSALVALLLLKARPVPAPVAA